MSGVPPAGPERVDLFDSTYRHFTGRVHDAIRKATFGTDIGQNSGTRRSDPGSGSSSRCTVPTMVGRYITHRSVSSRMRQAPPDFSSTTVAPA